MPTATIKSSEPGTLTDVSLVALNVFNHNITLDKLTLQHPTISGWPWKIKGKMRNPVGSVTKSRFFSSLYKLYYSNDYQ